jgi:hypothetical protein
MSLACEAIVIPGFGADLSAAIMSISVPAKPRRAGLSEFGTRFKSAEEFMTFITAGRARFVATSLESRKGLRFRVSVPGHRPDHFYVDAVTMGAREPVAVIGPDRTLRILGSAAQTLHARAFAYLWHYVAKGRLPPDAILQHEGTCGCCGRKLTVATSIESGLGEDCRARLARSAAA